LSTAPAALESHCSSETEDDSPRLARVSDAIHHATHLLPAQGPLEVFVHHNSLHAFEASEFEQAVVTGGRLYGCKPYLDEADYREKLRSGRIRPRDLEAVLLEDLGDEGDRLVACFGTRFALRMAMLRHELHTGSVNELRWVIAETDALRSFRKDLGFAAREIYISEFRQWLQTERAQADVDRAFAGSSHRAPREICDEVRRRVKLRDFDDGAGLESLALKLLWQVCRKGARKCEGKQTCGDQGTQGSRTPLPVRHRDLLLKYCGEDSDTLVHEVLIRLTAVFLDQGLADWALPDRERGLFHTFLEMYGQRLSAPTPWLRRVQGKARQVRLAGIPPLESIAQSLDHLGVGAAQEKSCILQTLLSLRGWAGMVWQMESNAEWSARPAPPGSLEEFLAVQLILDCCAAEEIASRHEIEVPLSELPGLLSTRSGDRALAHCESRAFLLFQIAQVRLWSPHELLNLSDLQWANLLEEVDSFGELERRRVFQLAYEHKYRNETCDAILTHARRIADASHAPGRAAYQVVCCIDEREESFRRHLEEYDPQSETFGMAGFFGVAMYYRGLGDAHYRPLCPVNIKPQRYVVEEPVYSHVEAERRRAQARRHFGRATHRTHRITRSFAGGMLTGVLGTLAAIPLVMRVLFPRSTAQFGRWFGRIVQTPSTELRLERVPQAESHEAGQIGFTVSEMVEIVATGLKSIGLTRPDVFADLVVICGHGSSSLNNPHEAAHDCGACGGGRGGPNARAFAEMANDLRVRRELADRGLSVPESTWFVGCYHNTCDDNVTWYDLDRIPFRLRALFERARNATEEARRRSAHERCRRFESAPPVMELEDALRHVETRAEDLSQTRPEYGHATNALCFVGRRAWSRGLFLDRRAFLTSYDPAQDDTEHSILERLLQAVVPVCAGINLEYYFSFVDPVGYGCGTKLPHNLTSLLGVMDGAASDLRPGLPWQMVEIHEPLRLLFVVETDPEAMQRIMQDNETISRLVVGGWVQLCLWNPEAKVLHRFLGGEFVRYEPDSWELPVAASSPGWYAGKREHLGFASIIPGVAGCATETYRPAKTNIQDLPGESV
jgi:uncharacterized protein